MSMAKLGVLPNGGAAPAIAVSLSDHIFDNEADVGPVSASFVFGNTGILSGDVFTEDVLPSLQWLTAVSAPTAALYELYVSKISGATLSSGTLNTWLSLGTTRTYTNIKSTFGATTTVLNVRLRVAATSQEVANVTFTLEARVWIPEVSG